MIPLASQLLAGFIYKQSLIVVTMIIIIVFSVVKNPILLLFLWHRKICCYCSKVIHTSGLLWNCTTFVRIQVTTASYIHPWPATIPHPPHSHQTTIQSAIHCYFTSSEQSTWRAKRHFLSSFTVCLQHLLFTALLGQSSAVICYVFWLKR